MIRGRRSYTLSLGFMFFLLVMGNCFASPQNSNISCTGQVIWQDIEGGFFGIITPDGTRYLPMNLLKGYCVDGVTITFNATVASDVTTLQMWGEPVEIQSITPVNMNSPFIQPWYTSDYQLSDGNQAEHLVMVSSGLQSGLDKIDQKVSSIAQNLTNSETDGATIKNNILPLIDIPGVYEVTFLDKKGIMTAIVPEKYEQFEGVDVSGQDYNVRLLSHPAPAMSEYFSTVEGFDSVIVSHPVLSSDKKVTGYLSAIVDPSLLIETYALPFLNETGYDLMVAQPDGTILYDNHPDMKGQKTWNNSIFSEYPDLLSWTAHYQNALAGIDQYSYVRENSPEVVKTDVIWSTVSLHGTSWRVFILRR